MVITRKKENVKQLILPLKNMIKFEKVIDLNSELKRQNKLLIE